MYIEGSDVGFSHQGTAFLAALGCNFISNDTQNVGIMIGQPSTIADGYVFSYNTGTDPNYSVDEITGISKNVIFKSSSSYSRTVSYESTQYRTITSSTVIGGLINDGENTRADLMATYLGYLLKIDGRVRGVVKDATNGEPVVGATVTVGSEFDITNDYGMYVVELQPGNYSLSCTNPGYSDYTYPGTIDLSYYETTWINIELTPTVSNDEHHQGLRNEITSICPNPFNRSTEIHFTLSESQKVDITVFNIKGQKISSLLSETMQAGHHTLAWNRRTTQFAPGVYFLKLNVQDVSNIKKVLILQ